MAKHSFFVTGTDTDVGKTVVTAGLLAAANKQDLKTFGLKPISAGCERTDDGLRNGDALAIMAASMRLVDLEVEVDPFAVVVPYDPGPSKGAPADVGGQEVV